MPEIQDAISLERTAQKLLEEKKIDEAFHAFDQAGFLYQRLAEHLKASLCFASAATCWNIHTGQQPLRNAATRSEMAAQEALKAKHYDYARRLFREATLLYEKEGDHDKYSSCYLAGQSASVKSFWSIFISGRKKEGLDETGLDVAWKQRFGAFFQWVMGSLGGLLWGHGERPFRTLIASWFVIVVCALIYQFSGLISADGIQRTVNFLEGLYFSVVTFATIGYGDFLPLGWARLVATLEGLAGIFLSPLFLVGLTRRYLRIYT